MIVELSHDSSMADLGGDEATEEGSLVEVRVTGRERGVEAVQLVGCRGSRQK